MEQEHRGLQLKELLEEVKLHLAEGTQCQPYTIDYLRRTNRLTLLRKPTGKGDSAIFSQKAIAEVLSYLHRSGGGEHEG